MVRLGGFFFKYRNILFIVLYLALFVPSIPLFSQHQFGDRYYLYPLLIGLVVTLLGQGLRGITISLAYIIRGGKNKQVYAEELVTQGVFAHCRNPLYVGNVLMLAGLGIMTNSLFYMGMVMPVFLFIYQAIVLAEEAFLQQKFGLFFRIYCQRVSRWKVRLRGLGKTIQRMQFNGRRWLIKEYNTQAIWMLGMALIVFFRYPAIFQECAALRNGLFLLVLSMIGSFYSFVRYKKKRGIWKE